MLFVFHTSEYSFRTFIEKCINSVHTITAAHVCSSTWCGMHWLLQSIIRTGTWEQKAGLLYVMIHLSIQYVYHVVLSRKFIALKKIFFQIFYVILIYKFNYTFHRFFCKSVQEMDVADNEILDRILLQRSRYELQQNNKITTDFLIGKFSRHFFS